MTLRPTQAVAADRVMMTLSSSSVAAAAAEPAAPSSFAAVATASTPASRGRRPSSPPLWGQCSGPAARAAANTRLTPADRKKLAQIPRPLPLEGPKIYQPTGSDASPALTGSWHSLSDPLLLNGLAITRYLNKVNDVAAEARERRQQQQQQAMHLPVASPATSFGQLPPPPEVISAPPARSMAADASPFGSGVRRRGNQAMFGSGGWASTDDGRVVATFNPPDLTSASARQLMHKSVAAVAAFLGYDDAEAAALNLLTDAAVIYVTKFCRLMRTKRDAENLNAGKSKCGGGGSRFADVLEATCHDMNIGSVLNLRSYYQHSVVRAHAALAARLQQTLESAGPATQPARVGHQLGVGGVYRPAAAAAADASTATFPAEMDESTDNIPEIHFPSSEEGDGGELDQATATQLETGLQMLQSLEQGGLVTAPSGHTSVIGSGKRVVGGAQWADGKDDDDDGDEDDEPLSHDSNSALLLATVSPGAAREHHGGGGARKRRRTADRPGTAFM